MSRGWVMHVDMDAFYAAVSLLERPDLRGLPVVVGGGWRSVVLAATYEARAYGVRSGIPMATARRLCPPLVVVRPDPDSYARVSEAVMAIFAEVTPQVEPVSMEEAFLDLSATGRRWGGPERIGGWIRDTVADEQGITCSVAPPPPRPSPRWPPGSPSRTACGWSPARRSSPSCTRCRWVRCGGWGSPPRPSCTGWACTRWPSWPTCP
ncbi:hypothetical protein [Serinicoccus sp. CUA-874]|uniref:Y-family DNA polymerase n=1 Tax=Serinicoccus sp. CUA-874 TaxID=1517939 RepID=UPI002AA2A507|nr:hypothetical protein [Serinicoccus sp. CUA-874]